MHRNKDVIGVLMDQHEQIKALLAKTCSSRGVNWSAFEEVKRLIAVHETSEKELVHPAIRAAGEYGERLAEARTREEARVWRMVDELEGMDGDRFEAAFEQLRAFLLAHADAEETEVFAVLAVTQPAEGLRTMAQALEVAFNAVPRQGRRRRLGRGPNPPSGPERVPLARPAHLPPTV
jgi:hypothetical protein